MNNKLKLTDNEKRDIVKYLEQGKPLPEKYRFLLFDDSREVELLWNDKVSFSVKMDESENNVIFKISDNGCGIPEEQQEKIFSKLFRADNVKQKNVNGVGLSLYLSKAIIDYAGGNIYFESKEGKGTSFFVSIPVLGMRSRKKGFKIV